MLSSTVLISAPFWHAVGKGFLITMSLTAFSMILGLTLAVGLAAMQVYARGGWVVLSQAYIFVFRGVPFLILLYLFYYGLPQFSWMRSGLIWDLFLSSPYRTALVVLTISNAAYLAEMVRGGMISVSRGLVEAGTAIGMSRFVTFRRIVAPIGFRAVLGNLGNETIAVVKASAITSVITVQDLMGGAAAVGQVYLDPFTPLLVVGVAYLIIVQLIEMGVDRLRRSLAIPGR